MKLKNRSIALFVADMYEDLEFWYPCYRLKEEGARVTVIGPDAIGYTGKHGMPARADLAVINADPADYDALVIPGGYAPDHMRRTPAMVDFVRAIHASGKWVATICHGGWMLASAGIIAGCRVTSFFSIRDDLVNAGAEWVDREVVTDGHVVTSRYPDDLPAFCREIIRVLS